MKVKIILVQCDKRGIFQGTVLISLTMEFFITFFFNETMNLDNSFWSNIFV